MCGAHGVCTRTGWPGAVNARWQELRGGRSGLRRVWGVCRFVSDLIRLRTEVPWWRENVVYLMRRRASTANDAVPVANTLVCSEQTPWIGWPMSLVNSAGAGFCEAWGCKCGTVGGMQVNATSTPSTETLQGALRLCCGCRRCAQVVGMAVRAVRHCTRPMTFGIVMIVCVCATAAYARVLIDLRQDAVVASLDEQHEARERTFELRRQFRTTAPLFESASHAISPVDQSSEPAARSS